eukprot:NODE_443_length_7346_cov_1.066648.p2 type:complete len:346 gc:universal NODE_443_length_7346_cov_1.066648:2678-3715(+)
MLFGLLIYGIVNIIVAGVGLFSMVPLLERQIFSILNNPKEIGQDLKEIPFDKILKLLNKLGGSIEAAKIHWGFYKRATEASLAVTPVHEEIFLKLSKYGYFINLIHSPLLNHIHSKYKIKSIHPDIFPVNIAKIAFVLDDPDKFEHLQFESLEPNEKPADVARFYTMVLSTPYAYAYELLRHSILTIDNLPLLELQILYYMIYNPHQSRDMLKDIIIQYKILYSTQISIFSDYKPFVIFFDMNKLTSFKQVKNEQSFHSFAYNQLLNGYGNEYLQLFDVFYADQTQNCERIISIRHQIDQYRLTLTATYENLQAIRREYETESTDFHCKSQIAFLFQRAEHLEEE